MKGRRCTGNRPVVQHCPDGNGRNLGVLLIISHWNLSDLWGFVIRHRRARRVGELSWEIRDLSNRKLQKRNHRTHKEMGPKSMRRDWRMRSEAEQNSGDQKVIRYWNLQNPQGRINGAGRQPPRSHSHMDRQELVSATSLFLVLARVPVSFIIRWNKRSS